MNGTQPIPDSTDTNCSSGNRSGTPESSSSVRWKPLPRNRLADTRAYAVAKPWLRMRSGAKSFSKSPEPMWKLIGRARSCAVAHSGSQ